MKPGASSAVIPIAIALMVLEALWFGWFLADPLPNTGSRAIRRFHLLIRSVPEVFVSGLKFRDSHLGAGVLHLSHVENLPQRLPIVAGTLLIATSAVAIGNLTLRALGLRTRLNRWERWAVGYGLGTTLLGLATLIVGRLGMLHPGTIRGALLIPIVLEGIAMIRGRSARGEIRPESTTGRWSTGATVGFGLVAGPFLLVLALGAMLPTIDFDAIEYHLQGPKEYYQAGRIALLPHNVYTSMPFGIEMLHLLGMEVADDWWVGALVGQCLVALFAPASAVLIGLTASRMGSPRAGWVAAAVYLTTPWVYRLATIPYVEGPLCYFHAALLWAAFRDFRGGAQSSSNPVGPLRLGLLVGLLAGGAMAIKYPGLISAVIPFTAWAVWKSSREKTLRVALGYALGVALVMAPWLAKNVVDTGNPVYPLGYGVFGASHWNPARDAKWSAAHGRKPIEVKAFLLSVVDVAGRSDWQSPLYVALGSLAFLRRDSWKSARWLMGFSAYLFLTWWLLTHRLDRFWLPMLAPLAILAGLGADWSRSRAWGVCLAVVMGLGVLLNATLSATNLAGLNEWTGNLAELRRTVPRQLNPALKRLDDELPPGAKPLLVGQAAVFHMNRPIVYNTVFDDETIETLARGKSPREVGEALKARGITHVYVDWFEVARYRSPGNYGFTPFVTPEFFRGLVEAKVLKPSTKLGTRQELFEVATNPAR